MDHFKIGRDVKVFVKENESIEGELLDFNDTGLTLFRKSYGENLFSPMASIISVHQRI